MKSARILAALETMIENFAINSFAQNEVTQEEAAVVMEALAGRFSRRAYNEMIMSMIAQVQPNVTIEQAEPVIKQAEPGTVPEGMEKTKATGKRANEAEKTEKLAVLKEFAEAADQENRPGKTSKGWEEMDADAQAED